MSRADLMTWAFAATFSIMATAVGVRAGGPTTSPTTMPMVATTRAAGDISTVEGVEIVPEAGGAVGGDSDMLIFSSLSNADKSELTATGRLSEIMNRFCPFGRQRLFLDTPLRDGRFEVHVKAKTEADEFDRLSKAVGQASGVHIAKARRLVPVLILAADETVKDRLPIVTGPLTMFEDNGLLPADSHGVERSKITIIGPMNYIRAALENTIGKPVIDETKLNEKYKLVFMVVKKPVAADYDTALGGFGLSLKTVDREIDCVVSEPLSATTRP